MGFLEALMLKKMLSDMKEHMKEATDDSVLRGYLESRRDYNKTKTVELENTVKVIGDELERRGYDLEEVWNEGNP